MLVLQRMIGEVIVIGGEIEVSLQEIRGNDRARIGIQAPPDVTVHRKEIEPEDELQERRHRPGRGDQTDAAAARYAPCPARSAEANGAAMTRVVKRSPWRQTAARVHEHGLREVLVALEPGCLVLRLKGLRRALRINWETLYTRAAFVEADAGRLAKRNKIPRRRHVHTSVRRGAIM